MNSPRTTRIVAAISCAAAILPLSPPIAFAGVRVALSPATQTVTPGSQFNIVIEVPEAGSAFNGFDAVVAFDPLALTFVPLSPTSQQQGCLMTGGCSAACGNTFHLFNAAGDSLSVSDVLLCNQITLTGPGPLYVLRFQASTTPQITQLTLQRARFVNGGLFVNPVTAFGATVGIGVELDVPGSPAVDFGVSIEPNPAIGTVRLGIHDGSRGPHDVQVLDLFGRRVRYLARERAAGESRLEWDGRNDAGERVPAGIYWVRVRSGDRIRHARVTLLQ